MNNTLFKGLQILEMLAYSSQPMRLTDIANNLNLFKSGTHRLLQALVDSKYVVQDKESGKYSTTCKLIELGSAVLPHLALKQQAEGVMQQLMRDTEESVHLSIQDQHDVVYLHKVDGPAPIPFYTHIGGRAPLYCVATGKALLAYKNDYFIEKIKQNLNPRTDNTIINSQQLEMELQEIKERGYSINKGELKAGVYGVAAPIIDNKGNIIAAIGLSGDSKRFTTKTINKYADLLMQAAQRITGLHNGHDQSANLQRLILSW
ncbi:IclR family transcriptional regulator [Advenella alkanexedens]|uniref:IclR family transcriptional regulator n=1 Tax=Advenella alkanexedens TaxID=1481665 RepID=A0ABS6NQA8_9BURK|nr:IclR family transcriptional regulator [Advenella alkanexedens]MBV4397770.1 IclR family transcriptional regulator [Advenella alkanexedens]